MVLTSTAADVRDGRQLHLNANITEAGKHAAAWRKQQDPLSFLDIGYFMDIGRIAEGATFDAVFLSDWPALAEKPPSKPWQALDPALVRTAVASATEHVGLIGTVSTSFGQPYDVARKFATLDILSGGRAAWNIVTTHGFARTTVRYAVETGITVRESIDRNGGAHRMGVGTPEQIADDIELWFRSRAADGFNLNFDVYPDGLQRFADHVVPELRRRGIFRHEYTESTLRDNLGLPNVDAGEGAPV
ncbi:LLM class flavin-dependent oxidoreductase [Rhodococcoides yunnanense]|uniref:LLM class flavin-dependent oxidoreductase n=1 Tax=Rhodococcoides yunnanense TaxID=278209 RepID=UPI002481CF8F|nr:LLM class flavin-dependent oxidoreductase [Rhodococcus yunnanensis]